MPKTICLRALVALGLLFPAISSADVFLNEFHYDDADSPTTGDTNESIEVVATAGEDLSLYDIVLYNGSSPAAATTYDTDALPVGSLVACGATVRFATIVYPQNGLQNGSNDGIALVLRSNSSVVQFLSYEGAITASNGPAAGMTSTNLPVSEAGTTLEGTSLQLGGNATTYAGFTWNGSAAATLGTCNNGQTFGAPPDVAPTIASSVPAHNDSGVAVDTPISVTFSEPVDVTGAWFDFNCGGVSLTPSAGPTTYTFTRSGPLPYGGLCNLVIDGSLVTDRDGTADPMGGIATIQFETVVDDLPAVIATTPAELATNVSRGANLSVTFNEPVTAPASAFGIFCPDTAAATLAFALSSDDDTLFVLDPAADLPASSSCKLTVDNLQIADKDGNPDAPDRDSAVFFSTAAIAPPEVVSTVPAKNSSNFPSAGDLQVVFDNNVTLGTGAFALACTQSTGISLSHAASGTTFVIGTGTALVAGDTCTFTIEADAVTSGDGLHPALDEVVNFTVAGSGPGAYYAQVNTSSAEQLRCSLHQIIDGHTAYPYTDTGTDTWDILNLADEDPVDTTMILDIYKNARYTKITGGTGIYNREHTWPNTYGFSGGSPGAYTDIHMLHLTNTQYNSDRGSKPFANCDVGCTEKPTDANYGIGGTGGGSSNYVVAGAGENNGSFEVWDAYKGNMARAMMYMVIRYEGDAGEPDLELTDNRSLITSAGSGGKHYMGLLTTLLQWHTADPVDARELARNELVYGFQNNRNPFVDHPEWGTLALMTSSQPASCTLGGGGNAAPVAVDDLYAAIEDSLLTVAALDGVLDNDTDADNDALTAALVAQAINGTVVLNSNGSFTYAPNANTCGADQFTYRASDGQAQSAVAIATINVACANDAPVANDATFGLAENSAAATVVGQVVASDVDAATTLTYAITGGNGSGAFAISAGGQITVANATPLNFETTPQFVLTVTVSDGALSDTAAVTVNLGNVEEGSAVANNDAATVAEDSSGNAIAVLGNDVADPDGGSLAVTAVGAAQHGSTSFTAAGVSYTPTANYCGADSFSYTLDGAFSATVSVTVSCANDAPVPAAALADRSGNEGEPIVAFSVVTGFSDLDGDDLDYSQTGLPAGLTLDAETGQVAGTPAAGSAAASPYTVVIAASDGTLSVQQSFQFTLGVRAERVFGDGFEGN